MEEMLKTGIPGNKELEEIQPSPERLARGAVAVLECFQNIPCNPCAEACKRGAILPFKDINDNPVLDPEKCNGCALCISSCPGSAIFVVDQTFSETETLIKLPYEFLPLPEKGSWVTGLNREGRPVCRARVIKVLNPRAQDRTPVVSLAVPKNMGFEVRNLCTEDFFGNNTMVCRCEEITLSEIRGLIKEGYTSLDELKRISRCGMGPCQGRTCRDIVLRELAEATGIPVAEQKMTTFRPPAKPVKLGLLLGEDADE